LRRALEMAIDWVDTARAYDGGSAERAVGRCIANLPNDLRPAVLTTGGIVTELTAPRSRSTAVLRPSVRCAQIDESLRRAG
jgi:aryl-alcohol dehydrogenase-like predicted oxidoreductase